jgi:hypothetical protein
MTTDPDQIRSDIEQTQQHLSANVDALAEKVSPPRAVGRQVQRTRSSLTSMKDKVMGTTTDRAPSMGQAAGSSASAAKDTLTAKASSAVSAAGSAPDMARQRTRGNPLVAGVVAFGAGWLLSSLLPATEPEQQIASQVKDKATETGQPVAQQLSQAGQRAVEELRQSAQQRAQAVKETAAGAASAVADEAQQQASGVAGHAQDARSRVTEQARPDGS